MFGTWPATSIPLLRTVGSRYLSDRPASGNVEVGAPSLQDHGGSRCIAVPNRRDGPKVSWWSGLHRRYGAAVTGNRDEGKGVDRGPSGSHDWDAAPPFTAPAWIDTDLDELSSLADLAEPAEGDGGDDEDRVASSVELAMKNLQRRRVRLEPGEEEAPLYCFGSGDDTVYAIEDSAGRLMIGRGVGRDGEGCIYCLVGAGSLALLTLLDNGEVMPSEVFDDAVELTLCSVFEADRVDNVVLVQHYHRFHDIPAEYRPGKPFLRFTDD